MVATSQPLATQVGVEVLQRGGSAVDAAIAANAALGLMEPTGAGIGGDLFAIVWDPPSRRLHGLNASGRSPEDLGHGELPRRGLTTMPEHGPLTVTVPGAVDGWWELHLRFGRASFADLLAPTIGYARDGFPLSPVIAGEWAASAGALAHYPNVAELYLPGGRAPRAGEVFRNPPLADTLEAIARGGRDAFYQGAIAQVVGAFVRAQGGFLSARDLARHTAQWVDPIPVRYRGCEVWQLPPNGQGLAVLQMLAILEGFDVAAMGAGSADWVHLFVEAKKLAYEDRARFYADPDFHPAPIAWLLSDAYSEERRRVIDLGRASTSHPHGQPPDHGDTVYLAAADSSGQMVSLIQSNYQGLGSGMVPPGLGFMLHNRGRLFDTTLGRPNSYAPLKRPFHTIIPGFVTRDGEPWLAFGVMGGAMQPQGQVQVLVNLLDFGLDLQAAGDAPRARHTGSSEPTGERAPAGAGGLVALEPALHDGVAAALQRRGHRVARATAGFGGYQAIARLTNGVYAGASESRKDGQAAGF